MKDKMKPGLIIGNGKRPKNIPELTFKGIPVEIRDDVESGRIYFINEDMMFPPLKDEE